MQNTGFIWGPETHCYGVKGFFTYGPTGKQLKLKIESIFRKIFEKYGFFEIETPCFYSLKAWQASGHLEKFGDEMFKTLTSDGVSLCGRPEMATTIFSLLEPLLQIFDENTPIKIYQTGIALPNDKQIEYQIRTRQYTAHEGHLIFKKNEFDYDQVIDLLKKMALLLMTSIGISNKILKFKEKIGAEKPFYATKAFGLYVQLDSEPDLELLGIQYRSNYDFKKHNQVFKNKINVKSQYPEDFEISFSSDRPIYVILQILLNKTNGRSFLDLPNLIAPYIFAVLPVNNNQKFINKAKIIANKITEVLGPTPIITLGKMSARYQKSDLMGILYLIVIDKFGKIFIRERNSGKQFPVVLKEFYNLLKNNDSKEILINKLKLLTYVNQTD